MSLREELDACACEFIGTFALVFFAAGAVMVDAMAGGGLGSIGAGIISGAIIAIVIYCFAHISGAHVNPALSVAALIVGQMRARRLPGYIVAQMGGSAAAGFVLLALLGSHGAMGANLPNEALGVTPAAAFFIELFLSFFLMWVICAAAFFAPPAMSALGGIAVGATVGIEVMLMGGVAGAAMNPARAFGPYLAMGDFTHYWIYVFGPIFGMSAGAVVFRLTHRRVISGG